MPNYSTYGVVLADLSKYGHRIDASATTSPTADQVAELIAARAAEWHGYLLSIGADPVAIAADTSLSAHSLGKEWITRAAAADVLQARTRDPSEVTLLLQEQTRQRLADIEARVSRLGDGAPAGVSASGAVHSSAERYAQIAAARSRQSLAMRLSYAGQL